MLIIGPHNHECDTGYTLQVRVTVTQVSVIVPVTSFDVSPLCVEFNQLFSLHLTVTTHHLLRHPAKKD